MQVGPPPAWTGGALHLLARVNCYMPANGETVTLPTSPSIPVGISLGLLKREMAQGERQGQLRWGLGGRVWLLGSDPNYCVDQCPIPTGLLPDAKKLGSARHPDHEG